MDTVSSSLAKSMDPVHIISVFEFPPSDSLSIMVNLESLKGTCDFLLLVRAMIHIPKQVSDWLIFLVSSSCYPVVCDLESFSLPAKSTRFNLLYLTSPFFVFYSRLKMNTV